MKMDKKKLVYLCVGACVTTTCFPAIQVDAAGLSAPSLNVGDQNTATGNYVATIGYKNKATGENSIVVGDNSQATGASSVAMGSEAKALAKNSFALGTKTTANGVSSVAFGNGTSTAAGATGATAFGYETKANAVSATAFGYQTEASGSNSTTFGNNTKASGEQSTAFGSETIAEGKNATAFGYKTNAKGEDATAFGIRTIASGTQATAFGLENIASAKSATAFGSNNTASGENSTVFGAKNIASGSLSTVFGFESKATNIQATAFGNSTEANGVVATAFGNESVANGTYATAFGNWTVANGTASTAFGAGSHAYGKKSTAFGSESRAHGENSLAALGGYTGANALNGVALGWGSKVEKADTYALGTLSTAHGEKGATAIGTSSLAAGDYTTAIGYQAGSQSTATMAPNDGTVRIDTSSLQKSNDSIFIGKNAGRDVLGADNVVIGNYNVADNAPGTNKGTFTGITAVGREAKVLSNKGVAVGYTSSVAANSESAIAIGDQASAKNAPKGIAIGKGAKAEAEDAISIGTGNTVSGAHSGAIGDPTTITGTGTYTIGNNNGIVAANNSGAFGNNNTFTGAINNVRIIGNNNTVTVDDAMILGNKSTVTGVAGVAIGTNAKANNANDVALGANSETTVAVGTPSASINGVTHNFAGIAPNSTVSVGKSGAERTITNVAAGRISATSTDAINGSQLFAVTEEINKGIVYAGDVKAAAAGANEFTQKLGEKTNIVGGVTNEADLTNNNIGVVSNGDDTLTVKLKKDVDLGANGSLKTGATTINNTGFTNGTTAITGTSVTTDKITVGPIIIDKNTGIDAGGKQITNVASGLGTQTLDTADANTLKNAATIADLKKAVGDSSYDWKLSDGTAPATNVADGSTVNIKGSANAAPTTTVGVTTTLNGNDIAVDLSQKAKDDIQKGVDAKTKVDTEGLTFTGDTGTTGAKKLGDTVTIKGGATGTLSDGNIGVASDGNGTLNVKLAKTLTGLDSVTAGGTTINNGGLTVGGKNYVSPTGINANDQKITNVADGTVGAGSKDAVNGGQLHDAKTELINKGLRFNADNNAEKTNKLGSKVTVNGDGNITTEITQTGDDTKIGVKLNKNLNVQTLTATDTVKAGGVTMGKHADSNNYVTGLDNKDWDVNTSNPVSGRAATEDQLKKISDVVKSQGAAATDYRLVKNTAAADGAYTVDSNGDVDLTVEDKNHAGSKETVKIKDVASKSSLDKLTDRAVKYDLDPAGTVDKTKVSYEGPTYANKTGGTHVTNVAYATGNNGSEAVNVDYLKDRIKDSEDALTNKGLKFDANSGGVKTNKLGSTVTVKGEGNDVDANYSGENIKTFITQDQDGNTTIDVKMNKNLKANSVAIAGKNGQDGVTIKGGDAKNGVDGTSINRLVTEDKDGNTHTLATLDDGMMYGGDTGNVIKKKLNNQVNVKGGISDESKLATEDNIGVVSDGSDTLKLRLAKELKGLTSATFTNGGNNTVINGDGMTINRAGGDAVSLTKDGLNNGGNKITNVADGTDPNDAVNKSQLDKATAAASTTVSAGNNITVTPSTNANGSKNYEVSLKDQVTLGSDATKQIAMDGTTGTIKAGDKVTIDGNKGTIKAGNVTIDGENGTIKAGDKVTIDGKDGKIAAGKVSVDGKDGYVTGLENKDWDPNHITSGRAATEDQLQKSHKSLDNKITNLGDEITKKGMNFAGNTGEFHRDLGQKVTIKGEGTESDDKYSGENIKTVADQDGNVTIKMAKDLKTDSLTTDKVKVGKNGKDGVSITGPNGADGTDGKVGITGKDGKDAVSMSGKDGVGHIGLTGKDGRNADITVDKGDPDLDGNNITRIKYQDENGKTHQVATKDDGMKYGGDSGSVIKKKLNEQVNVVGGITDASKLTTEDNLGVVSDGTGNLKVRMAKDLKGLETVTTKDAAGNTTVMNGGGVTITPASSNAVSLTKDGLNNGGNTITNVGPGVNGTDAVNVNQLKGATDGLANAINSVAGETQRVGAHAAAMSALKPIQYDPLEPTQVMAGIGNYRGETAAALGVAHYTAEDTMFHVGVSVGSYHNMVNAGVTRKFGTSDAKKAVPERYKGGPISSIYVMQDEMTALKAENARMQESLNELSSVKADNARMQQHDLELTAKYNQVQRDNEEMKAQIALLMQQVGLSK
ncbi:Hemagluttinin domain protein [Veillonella parvula DSM 2008]|uniref:YadA-like family protein n=1 Tax=Veillonella parvula TaxID=29466 RepID=UPI0001BDA2B9|nr:Hemagluttinin domain protein [Veillonella parvula DSM 2008]QQB16978.1 YadA-like family protein [Veillonella parvula]SNU93592.1 Hep_Hag [Veillonella parvula]